MNVTFVGGGSLRLLPIVRSLFQSGNSLKGGSIRLCDLKLERAEAVGRMIQKCPEYKDNECKVVWTDCLDTALEGTDVLYVTMALEQEPQYSLSLNISNKYGFMRSDQLSLNGAFLAARGGSVIFNFAKKMEQICPEAIMLIFANPVSVFSAMINNHTKIKAFGICQGFNNHYWDLPRLLGRDEYDETINVVASGVNHFSFITRGTWGNENIFSILDRDLADDWRPPEITTNIAPDAVQFVLTKLYNIYKRFGILVFSTEVDGFGHLFWEEIVEDQREKYQITRKNEIDAATMRWNTDIEKKFSTFMSYANRNDSSIWSAPPLSNENALFGVAKTCVENPLFNALSGNRPFQITASSVNNGVVDGFSNRTALEYTMHINGKEFHPVEGQYIPAPFHGLISSLAEFQTLTADALATEDPKIFSNALTAYPIGRCERRTVGYLRDMFDIYTTIPASLAKAKDYLMW